MIEAQTQKKITDVTGYTPANPQAAQYMTPAEVKSLHLDEWKLSEAALIFGRMCRGAPSTTRSGTK